MSDQQITMDENYDPTHKASSITSVTSTSTNCTAPSFYSGHDSTESVIDPEDNGPFEGFDPTASLAIPADDDFYIQAKQEPPPEYHDLLETFFDMGSLENHVGPTIVTPPEPIYLQQTTMSRKRRPSDASLPEYHHNRRLTDPLFTTTTSTSSTLQQPQHHLHQPPATITTATTSASAQSSTQDEEQQQQQQRARELLTDEERRANHIASEQKRRNTIRNGFKELTDIIPTLKNINNSKSTILFKAVEYVRHLEKRNRGLREKLASLQLRLEVEGRMVMNRASFYRHGNASSRSHNNSHNSSSGSTNAMAPETLAALMAHKNQQKQLELLQHQLRMQQELLAKHNIKYPSTPAALVVPANDVLRRQQQQQHHHHHGALDAPSLNIPADEEYGNETAQRERLLKLHPLYYHHPTKSSSASTLSTSSASAYRHHHH
ncbi:hypothetical protein BDB00DRAFT_793514 [Zychaea mexicana]|uniref:uncharacterized protein n=1 Tax=Zychaea mexicana TaxID=64656 RepID=UPI0022FEFA08|nr:uncharacterized protein BDB00DRAFT_793514 [Zychaea mexicana]KAI9472901.1 hypothetical protein BDB00DRAFT_793514 [Zychaea mexicana]